jgi:surface antigen
MTPIMRSDPPKLRAIYVAIGLLLTFATAATARGQAPNAPYGGLSDGDAALAHDTLQKTLEFRRSGDTAKWRNVETGTSGTITPLRTFRIASGAFCREFRETLVVADSPIERTDTACRRPDDVWLRVERQ